MLTVTPLCTCGHSEKHHYTPAPHACRTFCCRCKQFQTEADRLAAEPQPALFTFADSLGVGA